MVDECHQCGGSGFVHPVGEGGRPDYTRVVPCSFCRAGQTVHSARKSVETRHTSVSGATAGVKRVRVAPTTAKAPGPTQGRSDYPAGDQGSGTEEGQGSATLFSVQERGPVPVLTYTALATFLRCPKEYQLRFIRQISSADPFGTEVGVARFLHRLASRFLNLPPEKRTTDWLHKEFEAECSKSMEAEYRQSLAQYEDSATHLLVQHFSEASVYGTEVPFESHIGLASIKGRVDCIVRHAGSLEVVEFKLRDYLEFPGESETGRYLQLVFYCLGLRSSGIPVQKGAYCFFDSASVDAMDHWESLIGVGKGHIEMVVAALMQTADFPPRRGQLCATCGYRMRC